jgi:transposase
MGFKYALLMGRPPDQFVISGKQRRELETLLRGKRTPRVVAERASIVKALASGSTVAEVSQATGYSRNAVYRWRARFEQEGVEGLVDRERAGRPRELPAAKARQILTMTVERIPHEATHWSLRLMARYAGVSVYQVRQVWEAANLKPHRLRTFKISNDPHFAEKVQDVVGLYLDPPDNALVLSVDEKTQIQALDRTQPLLPLRPGQIERRTHDYTRHGTRSLYAAFDVASGEVMGRVTRKHRAREFVAFLDQIDRTTDAALDLHLIVDNSSTHKAPSVRSWLGRHPRVTLHFTPTSASWLNAVESWFAQLERRALYRGVFTNVTALRDEIHRYIQVHNAHHAKPFRWTKTAVSIISNHRRIRRNISNPTSQTGH